MKWLSFLKKRFWQQLLFTIGINSNFKGFIEAAPFQGESKGLCLPVLNCYSCPGALTSCPLGSLQYMIYSQGRHLSLLVIGLMGSAGVLAGRWFCGHLCPFGFYQDLLKKISSLSLRLPRFFTMIRYLILALFIIILPLILLKPAFCTYICPAGTLEGGLTLVWSLNIPLGVLYFWKVGLLILYSGFSVVIPRFFCRTTCPLGTMLGFFNRISLYTIRVDRDRCISCGACRTVCPSDINISEDPGSPECIRCGNCLPVCPVSCISFTPLVKKKGACHDISL
jgi:polyferredoxin